jgi:uncharacterized protein YxjI
MHYPLHLSFKILSFASQMSVTDANGQLVFYVKQQLFKLKEAITVFADEAQTQPLYTMNADRILDISARYNLADMAGNPLGAVKRQGMRSLWKAHYDILDHDTPIMTIHEEKGWVKVIDAVIGEVPLLGMFSGYIFHPAYLVTRLDGTVVMRLEKKPAFFEGKFEIESKMPLESREEQLVLLSVLMMVILERGRG